MKVTKELRGLSVAELNTRLTELRKERLKLNVQVAMGASPTSPGKLRQTKKNIARIITILQDKEVIQ